MQLADDNAFGAVDDERSVLRHQRNFAEEDFLFLDVADALLAGFRVFRIHRQPYRDLERRRVCHAALLAFLHVVLELQAYRVAALVAERHHVLIEGAAMPAENVARVERVCADGRAAIAAGGTEVVQAFQVAALALPVADRIIDEFEIADAAKIRNRENGIENRLQPDVFALIGQQIHLQEPLVRLLLHLDQVRDRNRSLNFRKINSLGGSAVILKIHSYTPDGRTAKAKRLRLTVQSQRRSGRTCLPARRMKKTGQVSNC